MSITDEEIPFHEQFKSSEEGLDQWVKWSRESPRRNGAECRAAWDDFTLSAPPKTDEHAIPTDKPTNPKDAVGVRKWRQSATVPRLVMHEVGVAMLEGALKYGRHNYRVAGVRASVYVDAAQGHIDQWWEGEDIDADSRLSHITKAIASLVVLRDAMINDMLNDDRPPKSNLDAVRRDMQGVVDYLFERYPEPMRPHTALDTEK